MVAIPVVVINTQMMFSLRGILGEGDTFKASSSQREGTPSRFALRLRRQKPFAAEGSFLECGHSPPVASQPMGRAAVQSIRIHQPRELPWFLSHCQAISASKQKLLGQTHHLSSEQGGETAAPHGRPLLPFSESQCRSQSQRERCSRGSSEGVPDSHLCILMGPFPVSPKLDLADAGRKGREGQEGM